MGKYIIRRLIWGLVAILASVAVLFLIMRLLPGSPVGRLVGYENYNNETAAFLTEKYGLNKPIYIQFLLYIRNLLNGDWGDSYVNGIPVWDVILPKIVPTVILTLPVALISFSLGVKIAFSSEQWSKAKTKVMLVICDFFCSLPNFLLALGLVYLLSYKLRIFPTVGMHDSRNEYVGLMNIVDVLYHIILPVLSLSIIDTAQFIKITKASIENEKKANYIDFLMLNGLSSKKVKGKYIFKNAIIPSLNTLSIAMTRIVSGALYVEIIFAWPGLGRLLYQSIMNRDYLVLSACFFLITVFVIAFMILIDIVHAVIDPRLRSRRYDFNSQI